jgi:hypothetical protein
VTLGLVLIGFFGRFLEFVLVASQFQDDFLSEAQNMLSFPVSAFYLNCGVVQLQVEGVIFKYFARCVDFFLDYLMPVLVIAM